MENFFHEDEFHRDLESLMSSLDIEDPKTLEDDWEIEVGETTLEPMFILNADWIAERLDEDRMTEDGDEVEDIFKLIKNNVDFTKVNELMPRLHYLNGKGFKITKQDLIDYCN